MSYSPKKMPISRSADSGESEPWTRLRRTSKWVVGRGRSRVAGGRPPADATLARDVVELGLAVGAELPAGVERLAARHARIAQLARAVRAAQELLLDLVVALRAEHVVQ